MPCFVKDHKSSCELFQLFFFNTRAGMKLSNGYAYLLQENDDGDMNGEIAGLN